MTNSTARNTQRSLILMAFGGLLAAGLITAGTAHASPELQKTLGGTSMGPVR